MKIKYYFILSFLLVLICYIGYSEFIRNKLYKKNKELTLNLQNYEKQKEVIDKLKQIVIQLEKDKPATVNLILNTIKDIEDFNFENIYDALAKIPTTTTQINTLEQVGFHGVSKYLDNDGWRIKNFKFPIHDYDRAFISCEYGSGWLNLKVEGQLISIYRDHTAIDIVSSLDYRIFSAYEGVVFKVGYNQDLGNYVQIKHVIDGNIYRTSYGHLAEIYVEESDKINSNTIIGALNRTGEMTTGYHLHFSISKWDNEHKRWYTINPFLISTYDKKISEVQYYNTM